MKAFILIILAGILLAACSKPKPAETERERYKREANEEMDHFCTNVVGYRRTISTLLHDWATNSSADVDPKVWYGKSEVEYLNRVGGAERTNITFHFTLYTNSFIKPPVCVVLDYESWEREDAKKQDEEFKALRKGLDNN